MGTYLSRIPRNCTDSFSSQIVQSQTLLLCLDVPDRKKSPTATSNKDVRNFLVPVYRFEVIRSSPRTPKAKRIGNVIQICYEELCKPQRLAYTKNVKNLQGCYALTSPLAPAVASSSDLNELNCNDLMAPLCFDVLDMNASLPSVSHGTY